MEKDNTFFICTNNFNGNVNDFYGPVLEDEIEKVKQEDFEGEETKVLSENLFKNLYYEEYISDFKENWVHYISTKIASNGICANIFEIEIIDCDDDSDKFSEIINVPFFGNISRRDNCIDLSIDVGANPHLVALLSLEINNYCDNIFDVAVTQPVYIDSNNNAYLNNEAYNKFELDKLKNFNLN